MGFDRHRIGCLFFAIFMPVALLVPYLTRDDEAPEESGRPDADLLAQVPHLGRPGDGFVGSQACAECHEDEHASWDRSFHSSMTQLALPETVKAPFDGVSLTSGKRHYALAREDDTFWVEMVDPAWDAEQVRRQPTVLLDSYPNPPRVRRRIVMVTGSHHMQMYWVGSPAADPDRRLYALPFAYVFEEQRWVPREDVFLFPPDRQRMLPVWNDNCLRCHTTGGQPRLLPKTGTFDTRVAELGIACEQCHGPGEEHARYHRAKRPAGELHGIVHPPSLDTVRSSHVCGQCHSISGPPTKEADIAWEMHGYTFKPGEDLFSKRGITRHPASLANKAEGKVPAQNFEMPAQLLDGVFWPDGMIRVSGREYNGLIESPCYLRGEMTCLSCHTMHSGDPNDQLLESMRGDEACLQCHGEIGEDLRAHTHHAPESSGSRCYNCHMPHTTHGLLSAIRSHQISSPRVADSLKPVGRPNACNLCHLDRSLTWTQHHMKPWYGAEPVAIPAELDRHAAALVWLLKGDAAQRALITWHMGWESAWAASGRDWIVPHLAPQMRSEPYAVNRLMAARALRKLRPADELDYDYIAPVSLRARTVQALLARWTKEKPRTLDRHGTHLLIDAQGRVDREKVKRLRRQRDDRPMYLAE